MDLSEKDFETILIAEGGWGPIDLKIAESNKNLAWCQQCSTLRVVFHNVQGEQIHVNEGDLEKRVAAAVWNLF